MRLLHTSDWHLGQTFYEFDRSNEHAAFLKWLVDAIKTQNVDVLLISGDVFDVSNPSAASVLQFYTFLKDAVHANPHLQIIVTAGNHDSPSRLEAPKPLLEVFNISIIGVVQRQVSENGTMEAIDYNQFIVPLKNKDGEITAWCMAVPFLRNGDYPVVPGASAPYTEGVVALYDGVYQAALSKKQPGHAIIAMGHLHTYGASTAEKNQDKSEREILGGAELIPSSCFNSGIAYTALGHIHRPQTIGGKNNIRYSGSPIPMSFTEHQYKHQVVIIDLEDENAINIEPLLIPVTIKLLRIPAKHANINRVIQELIELPDATTEDRSMSSYLEVRVLLDSPEPALRHKIETIIEKKDVRLARIDVHDPNKTGEADPAQSIEELNNLAPADVYKKVYQKKYQNEPAPELTAFFNEVVQEINQTA